MRLTAEWEQQRECRKRGNLRERAEDGSVSCFPLPIIRGSYKLLDEVDGSTSDFVAEWWTRGVAATGESPIVPHHGHSRTQEPVHDSPRLHGLSLVPCPLGLPGCHAWSLAPWASGLRGTQGWIRWTLLATDEWPLATESQETDMMRVRNLGRVFALNYW